MNLIEDRLDKLVSKVDMMIDKKQWDLIDVMLLDWEFKKHANEESFALASITLSVSKVLAYRHEFMKSFRKHLIDDVDRSLRDLM